MRIVTWLHTKPCGYVSHVKVVSIPSSKFIILAQFAIPWSRWAGHYVVSLEFKMSTVPSSRNLVKHQLCAIWHDLTFFCFGFFYLPLFFFLISDGRKTMSVGTLHSLQWPWSLFPPTWVTLQSKGWKILLGAAREDLRSGHPPPTLGIDRKRVLGQVHDGAFCLRHPKSHLAEDKIGGRALETLQVWSCLWGFFSLQEQIWSENEFYPSWTLIFFTCKCPYLSWNWNSGF